VRRKAAPWSKRLYRWTLCHEDGRAFRRHCSGAEEPVSESFPLALTTVRLRDQWHGASRSGWVAALDFPPPAVSVSPQTAAQAHFAHDDLVRLSTTRGSVLLPLEVNESQLPGHISVPMHYGPRWLLGYANAAGINALTLPASIRYRSN
jgi:assimilatory nitrate reductase catalytic subunit